MKVTRDDAVAILKAMGHGQASKYGMEKLKERFDSVVLDDDDIGDGIDSLDLTAAVKSVLEEVVYGDPDEVLELIPNPKESESLPDDDVDGGETDDGDDEEEDVGVDEDTGDGEEEAEVDEDDSDDPGGGEKEEEGVVEACLTIIVGEHTFEVGKYVEVNDPQDRVPWVGELIDIQNDEWGEIRSDDDKTWEARLEFLTPCAAPGKKQSKPKALARDRVVMKLIKGLGDKSVSIPALAAKADKLYAEQNAKYKKNEIRALNIVKNISAVLSYFGVVVVEGDEVSLKK